MILVGCSHVVEVNRVGMRSYQKSDDGPFLFLDVVVLDRHASLGRTVLHQAGCNVVRNAESKLSLEALF
jgi:hypothetical protein